eukprot:2644871-Alexandrium_andersonii.AAC.1
MDTGLPLTEYSDAAKGLESWRLRGSWTSCAACGNLQPKPLHEIDLRRDPPATVSAKQCRRCKAKRAQTCPRPEDVPVELRGRSLEAARALSPLDVDVGPETRSTDSVGRFNGCRKK